MRRVSDHRSRRALRSWMAALMLCAACAKSHTFASPTADAGAQEGSDTGPSTPPEAGAAFAPPGDAGAVEVEPARTLRELVDDFIASRARTAEAACPCQVEVGGYESVEECLGFTRPPADAAACMIRSLAPHDSPQVRETIACMAALGDLVVGCYEELECDTPKQAVCVGTPLDCFDERPTIFLAVSLACPEVI